MSDFIICREDGVNELLHYGVKGMKWGVRRNKKDDGSRTTKKRYEDIDESKKKGLTNKQKTVKKTIAGAIAVAAIIGGAYGAKKYVDIKSDKLVIARGKAIYDHVAATTPWHDGASFSRAMATASSRSTEYVGQKRKFTQKANLIKDYRKVVKSTSKGLDISDLDSRWLHYINKP